MQNELHNIFKHKNKMYLFTDDLCSWRWATREECIFQPGGGSEGNHVSFSSQSFAMTDVSYCSCFRLINFANSVRHGGWRSRTKKKKNNNKKIKSINFKIFPHPVDNKFE